MNPAALQRPQDVDFPHRDGATYQHARDGQRLHSQHHRVLAILRDGREHTLSELHQLTGDPEASVSARIRDLRKARFGSYRIERTYVRRGLHTYRLVLGQLELVA
jgi:hypothetical protein